MTDNINNDELVSCEQCEHFWQDFEDGLHGTRLAFGDNCGQLEGDQSIDREYEPIWKNCPLKKGNHGNTLDRQEALFC